MPEQTVADLGRLIKQKYSQYKDIPDVELGRKTKAKYPQYAQFSDIQGMEQIGALPTAGARPVPEELKPEEQQANSFWTSPHGLIRSGLRQAGHGVEAAAQPGWNAKMGGASEMIRGLGKAAIPAAIPLAIANPVGAASAIGAGTVAGYGTEQLAPLIGASPEGATLAGDVAGLTAGATAGRAVPAIARFARDLPPIPEGAYKRIPPVAKEGIRLAEDVRGWFRGRNAPPKPTPYPPGKGTGAPYKYPGPSEPEYGPSYRSTPKRASGSRSAPAGSPSAAPEPPNLETQLQKSIELKRGEKIDKLAGLLRKFQMSKDLAERATPAQRNEMARQIGIKSAVTEDEWGQVLRKLGSRSATPPLPPSRFGQE
jgi:hypothetical protein